jgi:pilus assembly protein CpaE
VTTSKLPNPARPDAARSARRFRAEARVLVVDDIPETLEHLRTLIESAPEYTVAAVAGSGGEAIATAEATRPDVILMDIVMPGMDGIAAAAEIYRLPLRVPIVIMSVQDDPSYMRRAAEIDASGYLI